MGNNKSHYNSNGAQPGKETPQKGINMSPQQIAELQSLQTNLKDLPDYFDTDDVINVYKSLLPYWERTEPHLFGDELDPVLDLKFAGFRMVDINAFFNGSYSQTQTHRANGKNPDADQLALTIKNNGWNAKFPPPAIMCNGPDKRLITGNTRFRILLENGVSRCIVSTWEPISDNPSRSDLTASYIRAGQYMQPPKDDTSGASVQKYDIVKSLIELADLEKIESNQLSLFVECERLTERSGFQPQTKSWIVQQAYNKFHPGHEIHAWTAASCRDKCRKDWKYQDGWVEKEKADVVHLYASTSSPDKVFGSALRLIDQDPNVNVRIIVHTSTLESQGNFEETYANKIKLYLTIIDNLIVRSATISGGNVKEIRRRIDTAYRIMPVLGEHHDMNQPVHYNRKTMELYQKDNGYTYSLV